MDSRLHLQPRAQRDENAVSNIGPIKPLHQRHKSTSALGAAFSQPLKPLNAPGPRRAAFADVSNVRKAALLEDGGKVKGSILDVKPIRPAQKESQISEVNAKPKAVLRPTHRALTQLNQKAVPAPPVNSTTVAAPHQVNVSNADHVPVRKTVVKRHTTIFRENSSNSASQAPALIELKSFASSIPQNFLSSTTIEVPSQVPTAAHALDPLPAHSLLETVAEPAPQESAQPFRPTTHIPQPIESIDPPYHILAEPELYLPALETQPTEDEVASPDAKAAALTPIAEPEEFWYEEDEEEFFDAEGCVTARSLRSIVGDNTTGSMAVLMPRVTARVSKELAAAKAWVAETGFAEVTDDEAWDTTMVTEYGDEIFNYMRELEARMMPNPHYMDTQSEIQWSMRSVLVDWVTQVHSRFGLLPETLFLAVNCIDRFLTVKVVSLAKLQLVGATAIYVAAKYEEINCPSVQEIAYMVDGSYSVDEILKAERFMLSMLKFDMGWPGPMSFLRRISKADDYDVETRTLAKYFLEITLMDERFIGCVPSFLAAGTHCLARLMLNKGDWGAAHVHFSQYTYSQLKHLMSTILHCCEQPRTHHAAVFEKYTDKRYKRASSFVEGEIMKGFELPAVGRESMGNTTMSFRRK